MSTHYKAFIVVFVVTFLALLFFRRPFAVAIGAKRFDNWRNLWLAIVVSAFFMTNYWLFMFVAALTIIVLSRAEPMKPAIYLLLVASIPTFGVHISGFASINRLIQVSPQMMFAAIILIPALFARRHMKKIAGVGQFADVLFFTWLILQLILATRAPTFTHMIRTALEAYLATAPMYYVFSRYPKSLEDIRILSGAFLLPMLILSAISIPELLRGWHVYNSVTTNWIGSISFAYTGRGGMLRASTSVFNPIVWGFLASVAIGVGLAFFNDRFPKNYKYAAFGLLTFGLIASLSRGPWVGAAVTVVMFTLLDRKFAARSAQLMFGGLVAFLVALATPFGKTIINMLPFVGNASTDTISYRQQLLDAGWEVMMMTPFFGTNDYLSHPNLQHLRQGQGIIDIVNSYLQVGLQSGLVGLSIFVGLFLCVLTALRKAMKSARKYDDTLSLYCQAYLATTVGIMVTIFTVSSVNQIPLVYWTFMGLGIALARVEAAQRVKSKAAAQSPVAENTEPKFVYR